MISDEDLGASVGKPGQKVRDKWSSFWKSFSFKKTIVYWTMKQIDDFGNIGTPELSTLEDSKQLIDIEINGSDRQITMRELSNGTHTSQLSRQLLT